MTFLAALFAATTILTLALLVIGLMGAADIVKREQDRTDRLEIALEAEVTAHADEIAAHDKTRDQLHAAVKAARAPRITLAADTSQFDEQISAALAFCESARDFTAIENHANGDPA